MKFVLRASSYLSQFTSGALFFLVSRVEALQRTVGPATDPVFENVSRICNGSDPASFDFGTCSNLISCVYDHLSSAYIAGLSSGTSIAALLPTILVLIGSSPLELVQLALVSPHRALATCCFGIGIPKGLFRHVQPLYTQFSDANPLKPTEREWVFPLPPAGSKGWHKSLAKIAIDVVIITLASIMLWRNYIINSYTMVPWRCEFSLLLFAWPIACMVWLVIAVVVLFLAMESLEISDTNDKSTKYHLWELVLLPYTFNWKCASRPRACQSMLFGEEPRMDTTVVSQTEVIQPKNVSFHDGAPIIYRRDTYIVPGKDCITVRITMRSNYGFLSWQWYQAIIESLAVGIYLYATFVLTSTLFLNAKESIINTTIMTLCLAAIRVLSALF